MKTIHTTITALIAIPLAVCAIAGCGPTPSPNAGQPSQTISSQTESPQEQWAKSHPSPYISKTAGQIAQAMRPKIPQVATMVVWTESNDPNNLMGRPFQYTSAASLYDERVAPGETGVDAGATIEVFVVDYDAQNRADYIASLKQGGLMGTEYQTLIGNALLRVTGTLTPTANEAYVAAFKSAVK